MQSQEGLNWQKHLTNINRVIDYVEQHMDSDLSLPTLAKLAHLSPFYFHRLFLTFYGERVHEFVTRKRIEKIANHLLRNKAISIKELCLQYGFDNPTSFSRSFKKYYGMSASALRKHSESNFNQIIKKQSSTGKTTISIAQYIQQIEETKTWMQANASVDIQKTNPIRVAYVRNQGRLDQVGPAFEALKNWALGKDLLDREPPKWMLLIHDNPAITEQPKMMQSAGLVLDATTTVGHEIGLLEIPAGYFAVGHLSLPHSYAAFKRAWDGMSIWLLEQGHIIREGHLFELFDGKGFFDPAQLHVVDLYVPIEKPSGKVIL